MATAPSKDKQYRITDMVTDVQAITGLSKKDSRTAVDAVFYAVIKGTKDTGYSNLAGLGKLVIRQTKGGERKAFGKVVNSEPKNKVKFTPSRRFRKVVNGEIELSLESADDDD